MDIMELGAIGELVGGVAVIGSLLYVGLQVRQNNNLARNAAELEVGRMQLDYIRVGIETDVADVYSRSLAEPESLSDADRQRVVWLNGMWFHMAQAMYRQYERGLLPGTSWHPLAHGMMEGIENVPLFREVWESNSWYLAPDFQRYIDARRDSHVAAENFDFERSFEAYRRRSGRRDDG